MKACIIAIGSEMLTPFRVDTNSLAITERLNRIGIDVRSKVIVGDDHVELGRVIESALSGVDVIICTGGLGPTADDITRETVAALWNVPLDLDEGIEARLKERFARRGLSMAPNNRRQALVPRGAVLLDNPNGTAPGLRLERNGVDLVLLPGPPREMTPMLERLIDDYLAPKAPGGGLFRRVVRIAGRTESDVDHRTQPVYERWRTQRVPITTTILGVFGQIELHLTAASASRTRADEALEAAIGELREVLGPSIFSTDGRSLEAVVGELLRMKGWTLAVAESCTGGLLTSRLTDVPGSSAYIERGVVCYSNRSKVEWLGVPAATIEAYGAVSEQVARDMASGIRLATGVTAGIGVTGIAGPGGGTPEKPVGTVAIALATPDEVRARSFRFLGNRDQIKSQSAQTALNMLRLTLLAQPEGA